MNEKGNAAWARTPSDDETWSDRIHSVSIGDKKGRRTPTRGEAKAAAAVVATSVTEWLNDRWEAAQKRNKAPRRRRPSGSGVTAVMKQISGEAAAREPEYVVLNLLPNRAMRRAGLAERDTGARNVPYVAPVVEQDR